MGQSKQFSSRIVHALILFGLAAILTACAGRPKQLKPSRPFNVTEVRVTAQSMMDFGFADRLKQRLDPTAGRATSDAGVSAVLHIVVLDRRAQQNSAGWFTLSWQQSASLDVAVVDAESGQLLRSSIVHADTAARNGQGAETIIIERLTGDIRALLGLSGYPPYPVAGAKRNVASPQARPEPLDGELTDPALLSADPLLNGTVTPTSLNVDIEPKSRPVIDLTRPLLSAEPEMEAPVAQDAVELKFPAKAPRMTADTEPLPMSANEPCIITLDNDCSDPDTR